MASLEEPRLGANSAIIDRRGMRGSAAAAYLGAKGIGFRGMRGTVVRLGLVAAAALALSACGFADSRSPLPEFMRAKESEPAPPEPPPDVKQMVREKLDSVFMAASNPGHVQVSPPHRDLRGQGWTACVRALQLTSANGKPLGAQTYRITISGGAIIDRRRVETDDTCTSESYEPI
jgi:hypothetical protein